MVVQEPHFASSPFQGPLHREWVDSPKINTVICPMKEFPELVRMYVYGLNNGRHSGNCRSAQ